MTLEGSWDFTEFHEKLGDKVGVFVPPFTDTQAKGVVEFPGNGFGVTSYSQHKAEAAAVPRLDGHPRGPEDHRRRRAHPGRRRASPATSRSPTRCSTSPANQGFTRYPMIDNVMQPEVTDVGDQGAQRRLRRDDDAARTRTKKMEDALKALPADRRGDTYTDPAAGG